MQQAIPYVSSVPAIKTTTGIAVTSNASPLPLSDSSSSDSNVERLVRENAVIVFGRRGCCMSHVVKLLLLGLGVNPTISDVDEEREAAVVDELSKIIGGDAGGGGGDDVRQPQFPAVFVGGKLFGGLEKVMATHITGELVPILKQAGALWL